jgi:hypothetical protein
MQEIAAVFDTLGLNSKIYQGAADIHRFVGQTLLANELVRLFRLLFAVGIWVLLFGLVKCGLSSGGTLKRKR